MWRNVFQLIHYGRRLAGRKRASSERTLMAPDKKRYIVLICACCARLLAHKL